MYNNTASVLKFPVTFCTRKHLFSKKKNGAAFLTIFHAQLILSVSCWRKIKMLCNLTSDLSGLSCWVVPRTQYSASQILCCIVTDLGEENKPVSSSLLVHVSWYLLAYECAILYIITCNSLWCNTCSLGTPGPWQAHNCTWDTACYFQLSGVTSGAEYQNSHILTSGGKKYFEMASIQLNSQKSWPWGQFRDLC